MQAGTRKHARTHARKDLIARALELAGLFGRERGHADGLDSVCRIEAAKEAAAIGADECCHGHIHVCRALRSDSKVRGYE